LVLPAGEAFAASHVVEQVGVRWIAGQQFAPSICRLGVVARLVKGPQWRKQLPAADLVRLSGNSTERNDRRAGLLAERGASDAWRYKHERPGGRVELLTIEFEGCAPA